MKTPQATTLNIRKADDRFHSDHGWLKSWHTFSFADHYHPDHIGFSTLRVINDDIVAPNQGFGLHPHRSMEIFTYIISGELEHRDSMGNGRIIRAGEFQYMSAGHGVQHSEMNPSSTEPVHLLQIWITPSEPGGTPRYAEATNLEQRPRNTLTLLASPDGTDASIQIRQNSTIHLGHLSKDHSLSPTLNQSNFWLQLISGSLKVASETLSPGDGLAISGPLPELNASEESQFLLFSLPQ